MVRKEARVELEVHMLVLFFVVEDSILSCYNNSVRYEGIPH